MSLPRLSPSHLLAQRLDALLGTKLAQQMLSATRPTTQDVIPPAPATPALENSTQAPERPPGPLPQRQPPPASQGTAQSGRSAPTSATSAAGAPAEKVAAGVGTTSVAISLGNTAQLLVQLLRQYPSSPAIIQTQPLLPQEANQSVQISSTMAAPGQAPAFSSPLAATLFQALTHALHHSGLFYESHLAQFAAGRYARAALQLEPQAQLGRKLQDSQGNIRASQAGASAPAAPPASTVTHPLPAGPMQMPDKQSLSTELRATSPGSSTPGTGTPASLAPAALASDRLSLKTLPPEAAVTIRQQLDVLALQTVHWRGEAWPNAPMYWNVTREPPHDTSPADITHASWSSQLTLHLPHLGEIQARLRLSGQALRIHLVAPQAQARLSAQAGNLRQQLQSVGLTVHQLQVSAGSDDGQTAPSRDDSPGNDSLPTQTPTP